MCSVMLHTKFEVLRFNSLAVRLMLRSVMGFGLVGLVWTAFVFGRRKAGYISDGVTGGGGGGGSRFV